MHPSLLQCDLWACGVILFILLCGYPPFDGPSEKAIKHAILKEEPDMSSAPWPNISQLAKQVVKMLLVGGCCVLHIHVQLMSHVPGRDVLLVGGCSLVLEPQLVPCACQGQPQGSLHVMVCQARVTCTSECLQCMVTRGAPLARWLQVLQALSWSTFGQANAPQAQQPMLNTCT